MSSKKMKQFSMPEQTVNFIGQEFPYSVFQLRKEFPTPLSFNGC